MSLNKLWVVAATAALAVSCDKTQAPPATAQSVAPATSNVADAKPTEGSALERALSKRGTVGVRGFSKVGSVKGSSLYNQVDIDVRELYDGEKPNDRIYGLLFSVRDGQGISRAFVDYDEIDPLLAGMDYAAKANHGIVHFRDYQVDYVTRGALKMSTYNDDKDALNALVEASGRGALFTMPQFAQVRELIVKSKILLDEARKPVAPPAK